MASFRCYDNCDVIETLMITSFQLYLIQLCSPPGNFSKSLFTATEFILKRRRYWPWITAPSHKCNNKLDCFLHEMLLITDSFFIKSNLQEPLKNVFSVRYLSVENIFFLSLLRDYWFLLFFSIPTFRGTFFVFIMDCLNYDLLGNIHRVFQTLGVQSPVYPPNQKNVLSM